MPRYLIVAGIDFGTSFTKVVLRDNNTPSSKAVVVCFPKHPDGLLPSLVRIQEDNLTPPTFSAGGVQVPYLKMLAAHVAGRKTLEQTPVRIPAALGALRHLRTDTALVRELLAFYFAHVIAATEDFIRTRSPCGILISRLGVRPISSSFNWPFQLDCLMIKENQKSFFVTPSLQAMN